MHLDAYILDGLEFYDVFYDEVYFKNRISKKISYKKYDRKF